MWLILLITLTTIWFIWTKWKLSYWQRKGVPHPEPSFIFGNIGATLNFTEHMGCLAQKWYNDFPDVPYVGYYIFSSPAVLIRDPELIKNVLIGDFDSFNENESYVSERHDELLSMSPFFCSGDKWKRGRAALVSAFSSAKTKSIYPSMESSCASFSNYLKSQPTGKDFEAKSLCIKYTTENTIKCMFSLDARCFEPGPNEFRELGRKVMQPSKLSALKFMVIPIFPKWLINLIPVPFLNSGAEKWFRDVVIENRASRTTLQTTGNDFMQALFNSALKMNNSDAELAGYSLTAFVDGFETSSTVLAFLFYELAKSPEIQKKVYNEIAEVSARHNNKFTYELIQDLTYLESAIHESQRLNAVLLQMNKVCTSTYTLPKFGSQSEGVQITPGTRIIIPVRAVHLNPEYYPNPEVFNPDRFTEDARKERHKAHFLPFGEGPRMCMGMRFGHLQTKAAAMTILRDFTITISPKHKPFVQSTESLLYHPKDGILLNFEPRVK